ncbi:MAG: tyrosine-protein phosphatase [Clostridia bacterium]|nr:tyrosine-protein phosphatase [Clostridia bacterium]
MLRHIPLGGIDNLRDLGGYAAENGCTTAWGRIFRSDTPKGLSDCDIRWLLDQKVTTLIDLRSGEEAARVPNQLAEHPAFHYHHCPLLGGEITMEREDEIGVGYFQTLDRKDSVREVMRLILNAPDGVLFHCMAGKDRTGMIAMLLLTLAGVSRADVLADYQISETYLEEMVRQLKATWVDMPYFAGRSRASYMETCLRLLSEKYGTVPAYLKATGLTDQELSRLKDKLLTD